MSDLPVLSSRVYLVLVLMLSGLACLTPVRLASSMLSLWSRHWDRAPFCAFSSSALSSALASVFVAPLLLLFPGQLPGVVKFLLVDLGYPCVPRPSLLRALRHELWLFALARSAYLVLFCEACFFGSCLVGSCLVGSCLVGSNVLMFSVAYGRAPGP